MRTPPRRRELETMNRTIGLETMCVGGGQGLAMVVERLDTI